MIVGVLSLPQPEDLSSLVLRTDFTDDAAWAEIQTVIGADGATYVSDPRYLDVTIQALVDADAAAADDDKLTYLFIADATTMSDPERTSGGIRRGRPPSVATIAHSVSAFATSRPSAILRSEVRRTEVTADHSAIQVVTTRSSPAYVGAR